MMIGKMALETQKRTESWIRTRLATRLPFLFRMPMVALAAKPVQNRPVENKKRRKSDEGFRKKKDSGALQSASVWLDSPRRLLTVKTLKRTPRGFQSNSQASGREAG